MRRCAGSILILVLFVLVVLSLTAVSFAYRAGLEHRAASERAMQVQLRAQAASAVAIAMGQLAENTHPFDHPAEPWHTHRPLAEQQWLEAWNPRDSVDPAVFETRYYVRDEEGKLNVLYASSEAMEALGMTAVQVDSLLDWMDEDETPRPEGAESSYYLSLPQPYRAKNRPLEVLEELLAVRGFHTRDYLGPEDGGAWRFAFADEQRHGEKPVPGWADLLTVLGDGRINLNTAPRQVLEALPISEQAVDQIVGFRAFDRNSGGELETHAFQSEADIDQLQGFTAADREVLQAIGRFESEHFRIFVEARHLPSDTVYRLQVLVHAGDEDVKVLQWQPGM